MSRANRNVRLMLWRCGTLSQWCSPGVSETGVGEAVQEHAQRCQDIRCAATSIRVWLTDGSLEWRHG